MIDIKAARQLLDFGSAVVGERRAEEQLEGAVALHNLLETKKVAYLADEVGMGKTYVALGALALFRHFKPDFRVLVIAPRENIQQKWIKEFGNFVANNVRFADLRVRSLRGGPARPLVACNNLASFVHEVGVDSRRDFFLRMTSFSLGLRDTEEAKTEVKRRLRQELPWLDPEALNLRNKEAFKDNYARAVCCALPVFDLVIVDEGHNLKHGYGESVASRNRLLALAMGRDGDADARLFPGYGRRAKKVLFLSATPIEDSYRHLWNQLDVFGLGGAYQELKALNTSDEVKKEVAAQFLVRRVTSMRVGEQKLTKNQYRREWREGGVDSHDRPIQIKDPRERLVVALVQKKVAELLGADRFNMSFQIGMLASFESFLQTAKLKKEEDAANFDDAEQARDLQEDIKEGIDVNSVNRIAKDYLKTFGSHLPHPKMDAVVSSLATAWQTGEKTLVFVRRVASVKELQRKLEERYDRWLLELLRRELPEVVRADFERVVRRFEAEKAELLQSKDAWQETRQAVGERTEDQGGANTFFAWFFRGDRSGNFTSGATIAKRLNQKGAALGTFFERNHVAEVLAVPVTDVVDALGRATGLTAADLQAKIGARAARYVSESAKKPTVGARFVAAQAASLELLGERSRDPAVASRAKEVHAIVYRDEVARKPRKGGVDVTSTLSMRTFFSELVQPEWAELRESIWPIPAGQDGVLNAREAELRAHLIGSSVRLGHGLIDFFLLTVNRPKQVEMRDRESEESGEEDAIATQIRDFLELLEKQRTTPLVDRRWAAYDELSQIARNFQLILDTNAPDVRNRPLPEVTRLFGTLLGQQQPVGGMFGTVNKTLVQQFRMPGYPFVLVTTDLLQEGEDLHTFCSSIQHYGISWTPSSMEQRTGRIDRVRSQTDRRLSALTRDPEGDELLQVHFPHLQDTVEILQVERVLERMNVFLRLMHEGLAVRAGEDKHVDVRAALARGRRPVERISGTLSSAFAIDPQLLKGDVKTLTVDAGVASRGNKRLQSLRNGIGVPLDVEWASDVQQGQLLGTVRLHSGRVQPFTLLLDSLGDRFLLRCLSPVGIVNLSADEHEILESVRGVKVRIAAVPEADSDSYNLTVQEEVLLADPAHDVVRAQLLLQRVALEADRLEEIHLPDEDRTLERFRGDLVREGRGVR